MTSSSSLIKPPPPSEWRRLVEFGIARGWLRPAAVVNPGITVVRQKAATVNPAITVVEPKDELTPI